ncbi:MAG: Rz-like lysis system protein LysB [Kluyvera intermedia]
MKTLILLLVLAVAGLLWMRHENTTLTSSFERANKVAGEQKTMISMLKSQIKTASRISGQNEIAQVMLRGELIEASARAQRREQTITRLLNENEQLRRWYSADLPDAVRQLHQRAACADAGDCLQRLPEGEPLPDAGK